MPGFKVIGLPAKQGDLTCDRRPQHRLYYSNDAHLQTWRDKVTAAADKAVASGALPVALKGVPVAVEITWTLPRPKSHWGTGRNAGLLKPEAINAFPTSAPDLDKLTRAVFDALTKSKALHDDAQITDGVIRKRYASTPHLQLPDTTPDPFDVLPVPGVVIRIET